MRSIDELRLAAANGIQEQDCGCWAGAVASCGRFPCPRRTMDPVLGNVSMSAPAPSVFARLPAILRSWRRCLR
jgi:hypothetical protein